MARVSCPRRGEVNSRRHGGAGADEGTKGQTRRINLLVATTARIDREGTREPCAPRQTHTGNEDRERWSSRKRRNCGPPKRVCGVVAALSAMHIEVAGFEIHVLPAQRDEFRRAEPVAKHEQDDRRIPHGMPAGLA